MLTFLFATVVALLVAGALGYALTFRAEDLFLKARQRRAERATLVSGRVGLDH